MDKNYQSIYALASPSGTSEAVVVAAGPFFVFLGMVAGRRWVALALRAIEQRGYRAWLKATTPFEPRATPLAMVRATKAGRVD